MSARFHLAQANVARMRAPLESPVMVEAGVAKLAQLRRRGRRAMTRALRPLALVLLFSACGPVPGGSLSGHTAPVPASWAAELPDGRRICEIEARPEKPYSIQVECFVFESRLHVQSHRWALASWWPVESWAAVLIAHPDVKVRLGDELFDVRAVRVDDEAQRAAVLRFRGYDPVPPGIVVFRFEPRA
ncbi:MAG TPA: hypothetical protein VMR31_03685 [Myxococcota bacterium]|nr:hypothetical protein [Myxococcota bacterium]